MKGVYETLLSHTILTIKLYSSFTNREHQVEESEQPAEGVMRPRRRPQSVPLTSTPASRATRGSSPGEAIVAAAAQTFPLDGGSPSSRRRRNSVEIRRRCGVAALPTNIYALTGTRGLGRSSGLALRWRRQPRVRWWPRARAGLRRLLQRRGGASCCCRVPWWCRGCGLVGRGPVVGCGFNPHRPPVSAASGLRCMVG
jgi:hypothetical protein